jgi:membrane-associated phospholipid phosphatase
VPADTLTAPRVAGREQKPRRELPDVWLAAAVALACALGMALVWLALDQSATVKLKDAVALHDLTRWNSPPVESVGSALLHLLEPVLFTIWAGALVLIALAKGRPRLALAFAIVLTLAPLSADRLKPLASLSHDTVGGTLLGAGSWPSGNATAATILVMCALLVAPAKGWRPAVALLGAAFMLAVGVFLVVLAWHMPSDVVGGYLLGTLWAALAVAGVRLSERVWPPARTRAAV